LSTKERQDFPETGIPEGNVPVVPAEVNLPEITIKAIVLSILLAAVLAAANAYLGLFAGMTVSASIPAAVASMAILRLFARSNILENNIIQTAASSGEAVAAGVIFTIPALVLIGAWTGFDYGQTAAIGAVGGILGVLFTIPLRRVLIVEERLRYPEGIATAEVLKAGSRGIPDWKKPTKAAAATPASGIRNLVLAALIGGSVKLGESGLRAWSEALEGGFGIGRSVIYGGINISPALLAVGFILRPATSAVIFAGGALAAFILIPLDGLLSAVPDSLAPADAAKLLWSTHIRFVGIGAMLIGGLWTIVTLRHAVAGGLRRTMRLGRSLGSTGQDFDGWPDRRTDRDAPMLWVVIPFAVALVPMTLIYTDAVGDLRVALLMTVVMALAGFLFSAVAGYMAGLVGSSSNPVSGVTIATIAFSAVLLVFVMGRENAAGPAAALLIGAVVCCAAAMAGDNLQDLKTGYLVGATPWKQQVMQIVGVVTAAAVIAPVLSLLQSKYGIGVVTADHPQPLTAPQATLMASLARGVFGGDLPWPMVGLGTSLGLIVILVDRRLEKTGCPIRVPVLAFALGLYLPLKLSATVLAGGLLAALAEKHSRGRGSKEGLLCAAGLITGEALVGILLAMPIALSSVWPAVSPDPLLLFSSPPLGAWPGLVALVATAAWLYKKAARRSGPASSQPE
jgi:putative OPT family oligopeptide transporter